MTVDFTGNAAAQVDEWIWHFGDGDTAVGQNVSHEYDAPGLYDVSLFIDGPLGRLRNFAPISSITIPVYYGGNMDISLDSISVFLTRGSAFESVQIISSSSSTYRFTLRMIANNGGGSPPLPPGNGLLFRAYFKYDVPPPIPGLNVFDTTRYSSYVFDCASSFGSYTPVILSGEVSLPGMRGDADGNDVIDVSDVVFLIAYIFAGGPAPTQYNGDANDDGIIDVTDAVYLIDFIFNGGPPPPPSL
jgi:hypothetical protein